MEKLLYNQKETMQLLGIGYSKLQELMHDGWLKPTPFDENKFSKTAIDAMLELGANPDGTKALHLKRIERENDTLKRENAKLKGIIAQMAVLTNSCVSDFAADILNQA